MKETLFNVNMHCSACKGNIENRLKKTKGIKDANANLVSSVVSVVYDENIINSTKIVEICRDIGYKCEPIEDEIELLKDEKSSKKEVIKLIIGVLILLPLMFFTMSDMYPQLIPNFLKEPIYLLPIFELILTTAIIGIFFSYYKSGFLSLIKGSPNMDSLVFLGSLFSLVYSVYFIIRLIISPDSFYIYEAVEGKIMFHTYLESASMILVFVSLGKFIENFSKRKAKSTISELLKLRPNEATLCKNGNLERIETKFLKQNDVILVKPGETIPLDGEIESGETSVDESLLTGESLPIYKKEGDKVIGGSLNKDGTIKVVITESKKDNLLNKIIKLVMEASNMDSKLTRKVDRVSRVFVPIVMVLSVLTFIFWLIFDLSRGEIFMMHHFSSIFDEAFSFSISVLVISCPCALGLATPISLLVGSSIFSKKGILVNKSEAIEALKEIDYLVLDKTNTITNGTLSVSEYKFFNEDKKYKNRIYTIEKFASHPLSEGIVEVLKNDAELDNDFKMIKNIAGKGVKGSYEEEIYIGNSKLLEEFGPKFSEENQRYYKEKSENGSLLIFAFTKNEIIAYFALEDKIKDNAKEFITEIKKFIPHVLLLTGDNKIIASKVASNVGIDEVISELLPEDKGKIVNDLIKNGHKVMMVGDGVNDSLALTSSTVGVGIAKGSDVALASSDFILMNNDLMDILTIFKLSKRIRNNINFNLIWAFGYNIIFIPIAAGVFSFAHIMLSPMYASMLMALSSVTVSLNSLTLFLFKDNYN